MTLRSSLASAAFAGRMLIEGEPLRYVRNWVRSLDPGYLLERPAPWMPFAVVERLERVLKPDLRVFEFGSGGSTLFWLRWARHLISVEHDPAWHSQLLPLVAGKPVDYRLVLPDPLPAGAPDPDPADPSLFGTADVAFRSMSFRTYVQQVDELDDRSIDVVCVDGRARPACIVHAAPKVRTGGILILDNSDREYYLRQTRSALKDFSLIEIRGYVPGLRERSTTSLFVRER